MTSNPGARVTCCFVGCSYVCRHMTLQLFECWTVGLSDLVGHWWVASEWDSMEKGRALVVHYGQCVYTTSPVWLPLVELITDSLLQRCSLLGILVARMWLLITELSRLGHWPLWAACIVVGCDHIFRICCSIFGSNSYC